jgi:single-stranded DNA-specific DHH superfamily exonuclease
MKSYCISHVEDVDGLSSAALVTAATGAEVVLTDYADLMRNLGRVPKDARKVVICDLGADSAESGAFVEKLVNLSRRAEVTYLDHHFLARRAEVELARSGVDLVHDVGECASILTYQKFESSLPEGAKKVALLGAVTDGMDDRPRAARLMEQGDRQFVLFEASLLSHALSFVGGKMGFRRVVVRELARMKQPHEVEGVARYALKQLAAEQELSERIRQLGHRMGNLAYVETNQYSGLMVANLLKGAFGVHVGVAMKAGRGGWREITLSGTSECAVHLGKTIGRIAAKLGGSGGGHELASGCRIPDGRQKEMLAELAACLE